MAASGSGNSNTQPTAADAATTSEQLQQQKNQQQQQQQPHHHNHHHPHFAAPQHIVTATLPASSSSASSSYQNMASPAAARRAARGILKNPTTDQGGSAPRLRWDEDNIQLTEAQKNSTMKITEPKTPFIHYNIDTDEITGNTGSIPPMELSEALGKAKGRSNSIGSILSSDSESGTRSSSRGPGSDWESTDEEREPMTEEDRAKHERFAKLRSQHYNMKAALERSRKLQDMDSEDDDASGKDRRQRRRLKFSAASSSSSSSGAANGGTGNEGEDDDDDDDDGENEQDIDAEDYQGEEDEEFALDGTIANRSQPKSFNLPTTSLASLPQSMTTSQTMDVDVPSTK